METQRSRTKHPQRRQQSGYRQKSNGRLDSRSEDKSRVEFKQGNRQKYAQRNNPVPKESPVEKLSLGRIVESRRRHSSEPVRLNKLISETGLTSRRNADKLISEGRVQVNGKTVYELGQKVLKNQDRIVVDGKPLKSVPEKIYIMLNKPRGVLTTMSDPMGRPTVADLIQEVPYRVFPIGRLDWDSEGVLLFTNDGEYSNAIMSPKSEITKTYLVKLDAPPAPEKIQKLLRGVSIIGGRVSARHIEKIKKVSENHPWVKVIISEGKNRQIRQMFAKVGLDVLKLQRVAIGRLRIGNLDRGQLVYLNDAAAQRVFLPDDPEELKVKKASRSVRFRPMGSRDSGRDSVRDSHGGSESRRSGRNTERL